MNSNSLQSPYTAPTSTASNEVKSTSNYPVGAAESTTAAKPGLRPEGGSVDSSNKLAEELLAFQRVARAIRANFTAAGDFEARCKQAFDIANDLFGNAPTWVCFYRALMGGEGFIPALFQDHEDFGRFLRSEQYHQIQLMLTALRSRDLPENDPNDPQRMITVRLPKSLHEALCDEAVRLGISVNRLCISRMLQLLDPKMIPETASKPRGRKPRTRASAAAVAATNNASAPISAGPTTNG